MGSKLKKNNNNNTTLEITGLNQYVILSPYKQVKIQDHFYNVNMFPKSYYRIFEIFGEA